MVSQLQSIFNVVWERAKDKRKSVDRAPILASGVYGDRCMYRSPDGLKCFAGALIPDEAYRPEWEGKMSVNVPCFDQFQEARTLIRQLQVIHDDDHPDNWEYELRVVAKRFGLEVPQ